MHVLARNFWHGLLPFIWKDLLLSTGVSSWTLSIRFHWKHSPTFLSALRFLSFVTLFQYSCFKSFIPGFEISCSYPLSPPGTSQRGGEPESGRAGDSSGEVALLIVWSTCVLPQSSISDSLALLDLDPFFGRTLPILSEAELTPIESILPLLSLRWDFSPFDSWPTLLAQSSSSTSRAPTQTDGRKPYTYGNLRGKSPSGLKAKDSVNISLQERAQNRLVISGTLPSRVLSSQVWIPAASMVTSVNFYTLRLVGSPVKSPRKMAQKDRWLHWKRLFNRFMCPMTALRESRFCGKMESWTRITQSTSQMGRCVA